MIAAIAASVVLRAPHVTAVLFVLIGPCSLQGPGREGNPELGSRMHLISQTGFSLSIMPDRSVRGNEDQDAYGLLEVQTLGFNNEVRIQGVETKLFLAMDQDGNLYGEANPDNEATVFVSGTNGLYNVYQAKTHAGEAAWYAGLRRSGVPKPGPLTNREQNAARFLPVRPPEGGRAARLL